MERPVSKLGCLQAAHGERSLLFAPRRRAQESLPACCLAQTKSRPGPVITLYQELGMILGTVSFLGRDVSYEPEKF